MNKVRGNTDKDTVLELTPTTIESKESTIVELQNKESRNFNGINEKLREKVHESGDDISVKIGSYQNSALLLQFQHKLRCKTSYFLANMFRILWNDEVCFILNPFLVWFVQGTKGLVVLFSSDIAEVLNGFIKWMVQKPRPFWVIPNLQNIDKTWRSDYSFPSSHAQFSSTWVFTLFIQFYDVIPWYIAFILIVLPICTGISRVYLGVHGFECVICGWINGLLIAVSMCYIFPSLFQWFGDITAVEAVVFIFGAAFIFPYLGLYAILKLFPAPNQQSIDEWTTIAISNTYDDTTDIQQIPIRKKTINPRQFKTYHLPICANVGGAFGAGILLWKPDLIPNFFDEECVVHKNNIGVMIYTVLVGYVGLAFVFPFIFIFPSKLRQNNQIKWADTCAMFASFAAGLWIIPICPYFAYLWFGRC